MSYVPLGRLPLVSSGAPRPASPRPSVSRSGMPRVVTSRPAMPSVVSPRIAAPRPAMPSVVSPRVVTSRPAMPSVVSSRPPAQKPSEPVTAALPPPAPSSEGMLAAVDETLRKLKTPLVFVQLLQQPQNQAKLLAPGHAGVLYLFSVLKVAHTPMELLPIFKKEFDVRKAYREVPPDEEALRLQRELQARARRVYGKKEPRPFAPLPPEARPQLVQDEKIELLAREDVVESPQVQRAAEVELEDAERNMLEVQSRYEDDLASEAELAKAEALLDLATSKAEKVSPAVVQEAEFVETPPAETPLVEEALFQTDSEEPLAEKAESSFPWTLVGIAALGGFILWSRSRK